MVAPSKKVCQKQRALIEIFVAEEENPANLHKKLKNAYIDKALRYSIVQRWARDVNLNSTDQQFCEISHQLRSTRPIRKNSGFNPS